MSNTSKILLLLAAVGLTASACTSSSSQFTAKEIRLVAFDECAELLNHIRATAEMWVGPSGLDGLYEFDSAGPLDEPDESNTPDELDTTADDDTAGRSSANPADGFGFSGSVNGHTTSAAYTSPELLEGIDFSGTNIAEQGVDEPHFVKTDGRRIFMILRNELAVVDVITRRITGSVQVAPVSRFNYNEGRSPALLINGDSVLLLAGDGDNLGTIIQRIVLNDGAPTVSETLRINSEYVTARSVDGVAHVIMRTYTQNDDFPFTYPSYWSTTENEAEATEANLAVVRASTLEDWLPSYVFTTADGTTERGLLPACQDIYAPSKFAGFGTTSVLTLPIDSTIGQEIEVTSVLASAENVHILPQSLYVSTWPWPDKKTLEKWHKMDSAEATYDAWDNLQVNIHRFDITDPTEVVYSASGLIPAAITIRQFSVSLGGYYSRSPISALGRSPFSFSEHDGNLRVVTMTGKRFEQSSESQIRVLSETDGLLIEVGRVDDIGPGNMVQGVRFDGDVGYVVTSRPEFDIFYSFFYTIDMSDPTDPTIIGKLPFPGFAKTFTSSFLYPVGDSLILAVGSALNEAKASLFDVNDLAEPREVAVWTAPNSSWNHSYQTFLWWAPDRLAVMPFRMRSDNYETTSQVWRGAVILKIDDGRIWELGRIEHPRGNCYCSWCSDKLSRCTAPIIYSAIMGDDLWTLSSSTEILTHGRHAPYGRFEVHDLATLEPLDSMKHIEYPE